MRLSWGLAALVPFAAAAAAPENKDAARMMEKPTTAAAAPVAINFSRDVGWAGTLAVEIQRAGDSSVFSTFNDDGNPEIGVWRSPIALAKFEQLAARLRASGYERLPQAATVVPGTKLVSFGERLPDQGAPTMRSFAVLPAPLAPVVAAIDELRRDLRAHPARVLRGKATWRSSEIARGDDASVELTLTNVGTATLNLSNPLADRQGWSGMRLAFTRDGAAGEQQRDLTAADLHPAPGAQHTAALSLAPGQSLRFEARKKVDLPAGRYAARVEYHSLTNPDDDAQFVGGVLWLDAGPLVVKRGPWWKLW